MARLLTVALATIIVASLSTGAITIGATDSAAHVLAKRNAAILDQL